ncbi:NRPS [Arthroderma sp. PD_2]|nr:NRPS [Arthroderma sp. PD_2]
MVTPHEVVCVHADRSINWIIAIYAVLKSQAVYCPLDPALPDDLRDSYFRTSGSRVFISTADESKVRNPSSCSLCYSVEELLCQADNTSGLVARSNDSKVSKKDLAYLCFTSGSSGLPKGVACAHEGIVAFQKDYDARLHMRPGLKVAQVMSPAFDGSMHEIFSCLSYGGTLLLSHTADVLSNIQQAEVAMITPSIGKMLNPCDHKNLEAIYLVGEQLPQAVCDAWSTTVPAYNMYGPTESSCGSSCKRLVHGEKVTIGKPVESTRIYILDQHQNLLPPGVIGELYTAGVQVSPGYIQRPEETAKNFLDDVIRPATGQKMYRTQDRGYWNESGEICLLGRSDRQIKLRGFRLDLNDLEIRMVANTNASSVAIARKDDILVAMVQPETTNIALFKETIKKVLPPQAIPRLIKAVDVFPLANAGKLDYKAIAAAFGVPTSDLSSPDRSVSLTSTAADAREAIATVWRTLLKLEDGHFLNDDSNFIELGGHSIKQITLSKRLSSILNRNITLADVMENTCFGEQVRKFLPAYSESSGSQSPLIESEATTPAVGIRDQISSIWQSLLSLEREYPLSDDSNFIELGGDSVLLLNLASRLSCLGGKHIPLRSVIESPCLGDQISLFSSSNSGSVADVSESEVNSELGRLSLSPIEREWVEKYKVGKGSSSFNVNYACALSGEVDMVRLVETWNKVLKRHEILSSLFPNEHTRSYAKVPPQVVVIDKIHIREEVNREFKLDKEHPIRVFVTPTTFLLVASHIVLDLTALNVILRDVEICWGGKVLLPLQRTYGQTTQWSRAVSQDDLSFWKSFSQVPCCREPSRLDYNGTSRVSKFPLETFQGMVQFTTKHSVTLHQLSLAAVSLALCHTGTENQLAVLGAPYLNRGVEDFDTVGLFLEPLPIRIDVPQLNRGDSIWQKDSPRETWSHTFSKSVGKSSQEALSHAIPWHRLLEHLAVQPQHPNVPFIEAMVTFHDNRGQKASAIPGAQQLYTWCEGSKFKLMFEFSAISNETLMLRIEYDNTIYDETEARNIERRTIAALSGLSQDLDQGEILELMRTAVERQRVSEDDGSKYFGISLADL